ncbi:MAG: nucleotidyltransferase domain-containing protein [Micromonosporaceae bacterium]|nr:nucleotidyltransferase domain-containing protein [Micromonosporaceae bacterium]
MPQNGCVPETNPRWRLAEQVTDAVRRRFFAEVLAAGVHGALAHGDDAEESGVTVVVVTHEPGTGPRPATRRVDGSVVELVVIDAGEYLRHARTLTTAWPLAADQYLTTKATYDPDDWYLRLRDTHLARLAEANAEEFAALAREAWFRGHTAAVDARRLATRYEPEAGLVALAEARVAVAVVDGLLTRTYFRDGPDAARRTGTAWLGLTELAHRLEEQAGRLAERGRPVSGTVADLFR